MDHPICRTCGVQYESARDDCPICTDERQYVGWDGQRWTTLADLRALEYEGTVTEEGPGVIGIGTTPAFAIGQRALLLRAGGGNVLWDMITYIDDDLVRRITDLGGISAIAISHPHYYGTMLEWAHIFEAPVYIHATDEQWLGRRDDSVILWDGDTREIAPGLTLVNAGVHFEGGTVLHWRDSPGSRGALFSGDILQVVRDRRWLSFMYSYPNLIPERPRTIRRALDLLRPFAFDRIYGAWWNYVVDTDGTGALQRSADRYLRFALDDSRNGESD
jgi:hypothetical protein